jgi:hypothetical protein
MQVTVSKKKKTDLQIEILSNIQLELFFLVELIKHIVLLYINVIDREQLVQWINNNLERKK